MAESPLLPIFRKDLRLFKGPNEPDGSPTYNLYDPVRAQYFKISWAESFVFRYLKPGMTFDELYTEIKANATFELSKEELAIFFEDAKRNNLLNLPRSSQLVMEEAERKKSNWFKWLLFNYLYIRIPVFHPDAFLTRTLKYARIFASKQAFVIYFILSILGIYSLITRWAEYLNTFTYFFNVSGFIFYASVVIFVKIIHEFSHAYTAKAYGIRVPTIGIVFIVLWPALYTDVTEGWKLSKRRDRLAISAAGIIAEIVVAAISTFAWSLCKPGLFQSMFFILSSASWLTTLAINVNPALRFDGYYLLSDLWGIDNLQPRAFAVARWKLREWIIGLKMPPPEENLSQKRILGMVVYSVYTWIYRIFLYTTIALFVYHKFTKVLGIFLFLIEIGVFLIWPIIWEVQEDVKLSKFFKMNKRFILSASLFVLFLAWFMLPISHYKRVDAVVLPLSNQVLYATHDSKVKSLHLKRGDSVKKGQLMAELYSEALEKEWLENQKEKGILEKQIAVLEKERATLAYLSEKKRDLEAVEEKIRGLTERKNEMVLTAEIDGTVYEYDENLKVNQPLHQGKVIGKIADLQTVKVIAFVPEIYIHHIYPGDSVTLILNQTHDTAEGKVIRLPPSTLKYLEYPALASTFGGNLAVQEDQDKHLVLQETLYPVEIEVSSTTVPLKFGQAGMIELHLRRYSYFMEWLKYFMTIFWKEGGL